MKTVRKIRCPHCGKKLKLITTFLETKEEVKK